jgi:hypothetical protein
LAPSDHPVGTAVDRSASTGWPAAADRRVTDRPGRPTIAAGSPETSGPNLSPGARLVQFGTDFVAVIIAAFVGVPLLVITFTLTITAILFFSVLGFAATGIAMLALPALGLVVIPALIAHIVESRKM